MAVFVSFAVFLNFMNCCTYFRRKTNNRIRNSKSTAKKSIVSVYALYCIFQCWFGIRIFFILNFTVDILVDRNFNINTAKIFVLNSITNLLSI